MLPVHTLGSHTLCTPKNNKSNKRQQINSARDLSRQIITADPINNQRIIGFPRFNYFNAFPTTMRCTLPYCEILGVNSASTANTLGTATSFVPNSMYAPLASGHQPYSFDQLCSATGPYTKYKVLGYKVKFTFCSNPTSASPLHVVIRVQNITDNYSMSAQLTENALERTGTKLVIVPAAICHAETTVSVPDLSVLFNWSKEQYTADVLQSVGSYGTSPTSLVGLQIAVSNPNANAATPVNVTAEFLFDVVFTERQSLPTS